MIKQDNEWYNVDWETAFLYVTKGLKGVIKDYGPSNVGVLASPSSTTEELYLLQKLMRALEVKNLDSRLGQSDFTLDNIVDSDLTYLGCSINEFSQSEAILLIGSLIREEQPLLASRIRQAVKQGTKLSVINIMNEDLLCKTHEQVTLDQREIAYFLAQVVKASGECGLFDLSDVEVSKQAANIADSLIKHKGHIVLGEIAKSLPNYSQIALLATQLSKNISGKFGVLASYANQVGANLVGFVPYKGAFGEKVNENGLNVLQMLEKKCKAYVLLNTELEQDVSNSQLALDALSSAQTVIVMSAFINDKMKEYADVILPITPYTETAGSYVNMEGKWQVFNGVTKPLADAKPAWKVLRVLANHLLISGFEYDSIEDVRTELSVLGNPEKILNNNVKLTKLTINKPDFNTLVRFGLSGIYNTDSIVRRAYSLQETYLAKLPTLSIHANLANKLGVIDKQVVRVNQGGVSDQFSLSICNDLPESTVLLMANKMTIGFGNRYDVIEINA